MERFHLRSAAYLLLIKDEKVLLLRRFNTGWMDGMYSLVSGHLDGDETVAESMAREAYEEAGITILPQDLQVVHVMHRKSNVEYIDFFLTSKTWSGEPKVMEKDKSDDIQWFPLQNLPENTLPHIRQAFNCFKKNIFFSEHNF